MQNTSRWTISRREFLRSSILSAGAFAVATLPLYARNLTDKPLLRFGIVTDSHYADAPDNGARCYRKSLDKMQECVELMNKQEVDFLIELGDFKDQGKPVSEESTLKFLDSIEAVYSGFKGPRYHVLGNHDADSISKRQFLSRIENTGVSKETRFYSFDKNGVHCVVLDANYKSDGTNYDHGNFNWKDANIPPKELEWLSTDLAVTKLPVICFVHQELNGDGNVINNAPQICKILAENGRVLAVFQGHHHAGAYKFVDNIHFYTLKCMVEGADLNSSSYAVVEVYSDDSIVIIGYRRATGKELKRQPV